jgi:hypothetical protein
VASPISDTSVKNDVRESGGELQASNWLLDKPRLFSVGSSSSSSSSSNSNSSSGSNEMRKGREETRRAEGRSENKSNEEDMGEGGGKAREEEPRDFETLSRRTNTQGVVAHTVESSANVKYCCRRGNEAHRLNNAITS